MGRRSGGSSVGSNQTRRFENGVSKLGRARGLSGKKIENLRGRMMKDFKAQDKEGREAMIRAVNQARSPQKGEAARPFDRSRVTQSVWREPGSIAGPSRPAAGASSRVLPEVSRPRGARTPAVSVPRRSGRGLNMGSLGSLGAVGALSVPIGQRKKA